MSIDKSIFDQYARFSCEINTFSLVIITPPTRYIVCGTDSQLNSRMYLCPLGLKQSPRYLCNPKLKGRSMLYHGFVQRRQHHVIILVQLGYRDNQQPMLFSSIAINDCRTNDRPPDLLVRKHLFRQRPFEIYHQILVKFQITHISTIKFLLFLSKNSRTNL